MTKRDFIDLLRARARNAGVFGGRFEPFNGDEDSWSYVRPAVDCFEPTISLKKDGVVEYLNYGKEEPEVYTYEEFAEKYRLV